MLIVITLVHDRFFLLHVVVNRSDCALGLCTFCLRLAFRKYRDFQILVLGHLIRVFEHSNGPFTVRHAIGLSIMNSNEFEVFLISL